MTETSAPRLLVGEDNEVNRRVMRAMLERLGYQPDIVENGRLVVDRAGDGKYDVILMDIQMPEMDGLEATRRLRAIRAEAPPWVIAVTANAMTEDRDRCFEAGMNDYLPKPVTMEQLSHALHRGLNALGISPPMPAEPARPAGDNDVLEGSALAGLRAAVGDEHVEALLQTFVTSARTSADNLRAALEAGDVGAIEAQSHRLKGSSAVIGARRLTAACSVVVEAARDGRIDHEGCLRLFEELEHAIAAVQPAS